MLLFLGTAGISGATLWDRGEGLIYDDVLDITWLQDANYAQTSGYDTSGEMTWNEANAWVESLVYSGYNDWRLPETLPVAGGDTYNHAYSYIGATDRGYNKSAPGSAYPGTTSNEMAYLYYNYLGNLGWLDLNGVHPDGHDFHNPNVTFIDGGTGESISFLNVQPQYYWSGMDTQYPQYNRAWEFGFNGGYQWVRDFNYPRHYAWAVRDGDSAPMPPVPEPATVLLLGFGLIGLAGVGRERKNKKGAKLK